jgi:uroporphyrinogen III methyltransferase/synthase
VIVVGSVVNLGKRLAWWTKKPLFGKTILVTRPREQASEFIGRLEQEGAVVIPFPLIRILPPSSYSRLDQALANLSQYHWIIFTSTNAVKYFFTRLFLRGKDTRALAAARIGAIGPRTAQSLEAYGIRPDLVPPEYDSPAILRQLGSVAGERILLPGSQLANDLLPRELKRKGATVDTVTTYRTVLDPESKARIKDLGAVSLNCITFTSASTWNNFTRLFGRQKEEILKTAVLASIGPLTTAAIRRGGGKVAIEAKEYTSAGLAEAILEYYRKKR